MLISPITEENASDEVKEYYQSLKTALHTPTLPLFFTYIGPFPRYLEYITQQLTRNLEAREFQQMTEAVSEQLHSMIHDTLPLSESLQDWVQRYKHSPSFYYFQNDLKNIYLTNVRLAFIFLALREAVKGWAIAAKKLPTETSSTGSHSHTQGIQEQDFIFDHIAVGEGFKPSPTQLHNESLVGTKHSLSVHQNAVEQNLLQEYLTLSRNEFSFYMKTTEFWSMRINGEKVILHSLSLMPALIFSPINVVLKLTADYKDFPDLLHLLSDHFPTYTVHRLLFSGFMRNNRPH